MNYFFSQPGSAGLGGGVITPPSPPLPAHAPGNSNTGTIRSLPIHSWACDNLTSESAKTYKVFIGASKIRRMFAPLDSNGVLTNYLLSCDRRQFLGRSTVSLSPQLSRCNQLFLNETPFCLMKISLVFFTYFCLVGLFFRW